MYLNVNVFYDGEVGINERFRTCIEDFPDWEMFYSSKIFTQIEDKQSRPIFHAYS